MTDVTRIRAGRLVEVVAGEVLTDQLLIARGERIESVGPYDDGPVDVDLSNHIVLPGLIDCHAHLIGEVESGHGYAALVQRTGGRRRFPGFGTRGTRSWPASRASGTSGPSERSSTSRFAMRSRPATCSVRGCSARARTSRARAAAAT